MGISGEIAGKPGGAALAEQVRKLEDSRPESITEIARRWREASGTTGNAAGDVTNAVTGLDGAWQGASADAFVGYMGQVRGGFDQAGSALESSAGALDRAAEAVRTAKDAVNGIGERALADAKQAEDTYHQAELAHPNDPAALELARRVRDDAITRAMESHADDARGKVDEANAALNGALSELTGSAEGMADVFTKIPKAGEQGFTPAPGRDTEWEFQEPAGPASTDQAGATGPGGDSAAGPGGSGASSGSGGPGGSAGGSDGSSGSGGSGGSGDLGSSGGPPSSGPPPGNVDQWIREAIEILQANGIPVTEADVEKIWTIIQKESGGDPHAVNDWDSNAAKGTPSKGLMQCIDPTFQAHKLPGHDDIYDPVDNIIAGVRYTFDRYGGFEGHPGLKSMAGGGGYQGY
ncbi:transglycosylase SLT domain-containing protein [Saccharopolyspora sp. 6V]|uniref:transglycosylase SLT domain-containing protein n=4 Tax=unclassified Saccharopolyspora TaxID=2646250 RepID=UPI001CD1BAEC|nr:transglycosylase SLT domain-containing protein [Saccharopolyspora sp. 6V]MCA1192979.1 transglycosylase SLT domain-containing protein [Saccharopolyspora sp. 6V]